MADVTLVWNLALILGKLAVFYPIESSNNVFCFRYPSANIIGGHVFANSIGGAACVSLVPVTASLLTPSCSILVNVDGAGTTDHPVVIENNTLGSVTPHMFFICDKVFPGSAFNVLPGSFVEATSMPPPTQIKGLCP